MVVELAEGSGFPGELSTGQKTTFDLTLAESLHREMRIAPAEAASGDVWAFLALVLMPDIAHWRFPNPPGDRVRGSDLTRHVFGRLWWRAQLVHAPGDPNPYGALKVLGEAAFDQIYARRAALGGSPHLIKSILRVWNDLNLRGLIEREVLREFLKRLLRLAPFVLFESVDDEALDIELRAVAHETVFGIQIRDGRSEADAMACADAVVAVQIPLPEPSSRPPADADRDFGLWLTGQLEQLNMSCPELAANLDVTPAAVSAWINGRSQPREQIKTKIGLVLGIEGP
ncbi:DUF6339 family protein [Nocardia sp. NPDC059246]|uniref:DUF6339 family protein n=1 Tax=unclassified Nocardia TaxID=2637762 RepID=UPI0036BA4110